MLTYLLLTLLGVVLLRASFIYYYQQYLKWESRGRHGLAYYALPLAKRLAFKKKIRFHSRLLLPFLRLERRLGKLPFQIPSFEYDKVYGPLGTSSAKQFQTAKSYTPRPSDIFVVSQMRSGTTWVRQIVYEILHDGLGNLYDNGHGPIDAISPWLESHDGIGVDQAPALAGGKRIIKTHLPVTLCPFDRAAKYIYITRHPVHCFASIVDFFHLMTGLLSPSEQELADWFCSNRMWWNPWPNHVAGWWAQSQMNDNVYFAYFETLQRKSCEEILKISRFLGKEIFGRVLDQIVNKCSFDYMKANEVQFEMSPPNLHSVSGTFFKSGHRKTNAIAAPFSNRILNFCAERLEKSDYLQNTPYDDLRTRMYEQHPVGQV